MLSYPNIFKAVVKDYDRNNLAYHNIAHINRMNCNALDMLQQHCLELDCQVGAGDVQVLALAILGHDIRYVPGARDNEARSATRMAEIIKKSDDELQDWVAKDVCRLILGTAGEIPCDDLVGRVLHDLDWLVFASPIVKYSQEYLRPLYVEYLNVIDPEKFFDGRREFLRALEPRMFCSSMMNTRYAANVNTNIDWELDIYLPIRIETRERGCI